MSAKRGFFSIFSSSSSKRVTEEEAMQRSHALAMEKESKAEDARESSQEAAEGLKVEAVVDDSPQEETVKHEATEEMAEFCVSQLDQLLSMSGFPSEIKLVKRDGHKIFVEITNATDIGRIIGREGGTLEAFQILVRAFLFQKYGHPVALILDAGNYRKKRRDIVKSQALRAARVVVDERKDVELPSMNAAERRQIHVLFKGHKKIRTESVGNGLGRHVVLANRD